MPLNKPSGNMYPDCYTWNPLGGDCEHQCVYCYARNKIHPWQRRLGNTKYVGMPHLVESELETRLVIPSGYMIFVQSNGDLFARGVLPDYISTTLAHCRQFPRTSFLFQTKNPARFLAYTFDFPMDTILGTTIETNRDYHTYHGKAPSFREDRFQIMKNLRSICRFRVMISIEPVMDFDLEILVGWMREILPSYVSIGADTGGNKLIEPSKEKLEQLISELNRFTLVKSKKNLSRFGIEVGDS